MLFLTSQDYKILNSINTYIVNRNELYESDFYKNMPQQIRDKA
jgi:hypothetical protein